MFGCPILGTSLFLCQGWETAKASPVLAVASASALAVALPSPATNAGCPIHHELVMGGKPQKPAPVLPLHLPLPLPLLFCLSFPAGNLLLPSPSPFRPPVPEKTPLPVPNPPSPSSAKGALYPSPANRAGYTARESPRAESPPYISHSVNPIHRALRCQPKYKSDSAIAEPSSNPTGRESHRNESLIGPITQSEIAFNSQSGAKQSTRLPYPKLQRFCLLSI